MTAQDFLELSDEQLLEQCEVHNYRSSGPGGQHRNKTSSAVRLHHEPTGLIAKAEEDRSQHVNKRRALKRLRLIIATEVPADIDDGQYPLGEQRRKELLDGHRHASLKDPRCLLTVNELLSLMEAADGQVATVAERLGVNTATILKWFELDVHFWRKVNQIRQQHGLPMLKSAH